MRCFTPRPLGPLLDIAGTLAGELAALVASAARPHEIAAAHLGELSGRATTIVVLEDVHWADEATLDVLRLLARRVEAVRALVLVSYRDDELDRTRPLRIVLGELATGLAVARIELARSRLRQLKSWPGRTVSTGTSSTARRRGTRARRP